jgi:23S rRNA (cytidine1920-2'-O)/16S rRNA (cytidine1409-2'-O)-methyltransferase
LATKQRLDLLLVELGLAESRSKAAALVMAGQVVVGDHRADKAGHRYPVDAEIRIKGDGLTYVSRGGLKLEAAVEAWPVPLEDVVALDVGASTGGFTDLLLQRGAAQVYAVDVGHNQLAWSLRQDPRVINLEKTHIAKLEVGRLTPPPSVVVIDVSFISLHRVLPVLPPHLTADAVVYALVKPQFEVGKERVGKGGIIRDPADRQGALDAVIACAEGLGFRLLGSLESPIQGAKGNIEFLAGFAWSAAQIPVGKTEPEPSASQ